MKAKPGFILPFVMFILLACNPGKQDMLMQAYISEI
jgi:hypothetical protein